MRLGSTSPCIGGEGVWSGEPHRGVVAWAGGGDDIGNAYGDGDRVCARPGAFGLRPCSVTHIVPLSLAVASPPMSPPVSFATSASALLCSAMAVALSLCWLPLFCAVSVGMLASRLARVITSNRCHCDMACDVRGGVPLDRLCRRAVTSALVSADGGPLVGTKPRVRVRAMRGGDGGVGVGDGDDVETMAGVRVGTKPRVGVGGVLRGVRVRAMGVRVGIMPRVACVRVACVGVGVLRAGGDGVPRMPGGGDGVLRVGAMPGVAMPGVAMPGVGVLRVRTKPGVGLGGVGVGRGEVLGEQPGVRRPIGTKGGEVVTCPMREACTMTLAMPRGTGGDGDKRGERSTARRGGVGR